METLDLYKFSRALIRTGDLDPVYVGLQAFTGAYLKRWLVVYWYFYHCGVACYLARLEGKAFWKGMYQAAENRVAPIGLAHSRWPRSAERRHFRGKAATDAVAQLARAYPRPEYLVDCIAGGASAFVEVKRRMELLPLCGPWVSYKAADMLERVLRVPIIFDRAEVFMYREPYSAALLHYNRENPKTHDEPIDTALAVQWALTDLQRNLRGVMAPPHNDRKIGAQELETCFCKAKSHWNGRYWVGKDIHEVRRGLQEWSRISDEAGLMLEAMPEEVELCKRLW